MKELWTQCRNWMIDHRYIAIAIGILVILVLLSIKN